MARIFFIFYYSSFGKVFLGNYNGSSVAIKQYSTLTTEDNTSEAQLFSKFHSPYIVNFFGICQTMNSLVIEFCKFGSIDSCYNRKEMNDSFKLLACLDCARGMKVLLLFLLSI